MSWTNQEKNKLLQIGHLYTNIELEQFFPNKTFKQIQTKCNHLDILKLPEVRSRAKRIYNINKDYFKTENYNMAYILGLWWADGSICPSPTTNKLYEFNITNKYDKLLLENIRNELGSNIPLKIHKKTGSHVLKIFNTTICEDIQKLGGIQNKSCKFIWPNISKKYFGSFLRGLFDGDGCIYRKNKKQYPNYFRGQISSGNLKFCETLKIILMNDYNIDSYIEHNQSNNGNCFNIHFNQTELYKLGYVLYDNLTHLYLKYKYDLFYQFYHK